MSFLVAGATIKCNHSFVICMFVVFFSCRQKKIKGVIVTVICKHAIVKDELPCLQITSTNEGPYFTFNEEHICP